MLSNGEHRVKGESNQMPTDAFAAALGTMVPMTREDVKSSHLPGPSFRFRCLRCASVLEARASQSGREGRCPSCDAMFTIPQVDPETGLAAGNADPGEDGELPAPVHAYAAAGHAAPRIIRMPDDNLVIECPSCQRQSPITANGCPQCGRPFTLEGALQRVDVSQSAAGTQALSLAVVAILLSFFGGIGMVPGIAALVVALRDLAGGREKASRRNSVIGFVLALVGCVISAFFLTQFLSSL
jgi:hypothetical protein